MLKAIISQLYQQPALLIALGGTAMTLLLSMGGRSQKGGNCTPDEYRMSSVGVQVNGQEEPCLM